MNVQVLKLNVGLDNAQLLPIAVHRGAMREFRFVGDARNGVYVNINALRREFPCYTFFYDKRRTVFAMPRKKISVPQMSPTRIAHVVEQLRRLNWLPLQAAKRPTMPALALGVIHDLHQGKIVRLGSEIAADTSLYKDEIIDHYNTVYEGLLNFSLTLDYDIISMCLVEQKNEVFFIEE